MKKLLFITGLFSIGILSACDTYEERRTERSIEEVQNVELEDSENPKASEPEEIDIDTVENTDNI